MHHSKHINIAVVDANPERARVIEEGLREVGYESITLIFEMNGLLDRLVRLEPDVILIDLENPSRDVLEQMFLITREIKRPVAMFVDDSDMSTIEEAVNAGVGAYIVDGLTQKRVQSILATAISRFNHYACLQAELDTAKQALSERKLLDKAKGILMKMKGISEEEAYGLIRKTAMNQSRKTSEIAQSIVTTAELMK